MIETIPDEDLIITKQDFEDVEEMLEELLDREERNFRIRFGDRHQPKRIRVGRSSAMPLRGLGAAVAALAMVQALSQVLKTVETYQTTRTRRRRATEICVRECLGIVANAMQDVKAEWWTERALTTETGETKYKRRFKSRK